MFRRLNVNNGLPMVHPSKNPGNYKQIAPKRKTDPGWVRALQLRILLGLAVPGPKVTGRRRLAANQLWAV